MLGIMIFAAAAAASPVTAIDSPGTQAASRCTWQSGVQTTDDRSGGAVRIRKLNELPNADEYKAVLRRDERGCEKPLIVRYDIGGAPGKRR